MEANMKPEAVKDYCSTHANLALARQDPVYFSGAPDYCDACGRSLFLEEFLAELACWPCSKDSTPARMPR